MAETPISRQAVIVIHGIGEQKPMDTLREFVQEIAPEIDNSNKRKFFNKPDTFSGLFELRRMTSNLHADSFKTDYFEYYWAHNMQNNKISDVFWWMLSLVLRPFNFNKINFSIAEIPKRIRFVFFGLWLIILSLATFFCFGIYDYLNCGNLFKIFWDFFSSNWVKAITISVLSVTYKVIANYLGDVARYMTPKAHNIGNREAIRKNAFQLLEKLHGLKEKEGNKEINVYDRIMIVGHSLGSVIAYDVINLYWNQIHNNTSKIHSSIIVDNENAALALKKNYESLTKELSNENPKSYIYDLERFREEQFKLWKIQYKNEGSWRISDFITLGSPLTYANLFLATSNEIFEAKKEERELSTCPPTFEFFGGRDDDKKNHFSFPHKLEQSENTPLTLHHAAAFSMTRWTNFYFKNDFVGGKIGGLGGGIENVSAMIPEKKLFGFIPLRAKIPFLSHIYYWDKNEQKSIKMIREKLELIFKQDI